MRSFTAVFHDDGGASTDDGKNFVEDPAKGIVASNNQNNPNTTHAGVAISGSGPFHIEINAGNQALDSTVTSTHYLCGFHVGQP